MKRRSFVQNALAVSAGTLVTSKTSIPFSKKRNEPLKGNIRQSVSRWCFNQYPLETFLPILKELGVFALDLVGLKDWAILKKYDIDCSMCNGAEINLVDGWNDLRFHKQLIKQYRAMIPKVAAAGYRNLICFSGNSRGMGAQEGLENCMKGLKEILSLAERHDVCIVMELFNSKIDHPDYMCDNTPWGVQLCDSLGSDNFKLLYDIYHMQISEGDIIRTIQEYHSYFAHYHTAGVPGRNEINETQELNYPAIMKAIVATKFEGYVAQEFIPTYDDPISSLREAIAICDV